VPEGSETRLGIDRDEDGVLDHDEVLACSDPADAASVPGDWSDLGNGLAGTHGVPVLAGCGSLLGGEDVTLELTGALEHTFAHLVIGATLIDAPFKGVTLVPSPLLVVLNVSTGPSGAIGLTGAMPPGLPSASQVVFHWWIADPAGPVGFAASNALSGTTP
jgi:hypothetical protein